MDDANEKISIDDFKKVEIRIGEIRSVEKIPDSEKLLQLEVFFGGSETRQIVSGIALYFPDLHTLIGKRVAFAYNLAPRTIMGFQSNGMILAGHDESGNFSLLETHGINPGARIG